MPSLVQIGPGTLKLQGTSCLATWWRYDDNWREQCLRVQSGALNNPLRFGTDWTINGRVTQYFLLLGESVILWGRHAHALCRNTKLLITFHFQWLFFKLTKFEGHGIYPLGGVRSNTTPRNGQNMGQIWQSIQNGWLPVGFTTGCQWNYFEVLAWYICRENFVNVDST